MDSGHLGDTAAVASGENHSWADMGGSPGDGIHGTVPAPTPYPGTVATSTPTPYSTPQRPAETSGSITRFATPEMSAQQQPAVFGGANVVSAKSYAERSAQAYNSAPQTGASMPAAYGAMPQSAYGMAPQPSAMQPAYGGMPPPVSGSATQPGSYLARSAQAYSNTQQAPLAAGYAARTPAVSTPAYGAPVPPASTAQIAAGSYAQRSAQAYAQTPQPPSFGQPQPQSVYPQSQPSLYGQQPPQAYGSQPPVPTYGQPQPPPTPQLYGQPNAQQRQPPTAVYNQQPVQQPSYGQPPPPPPQPPGSYAERSAQAYGQYPPPQQPPQQQQQQQQPAYPSMQPQPQYPSVIAHHPGSATVSTMTAPVIQGVPSPQAQAIQQRLLTEATRKVQEHAYYMRQAMEQRNLPVVLDRAAHMVGELGGLPHGHHHPTTGGAPGANNAATNASPITNGPSNTGASSKLTPKNYYELYMRSLEDMPAFEDFLLNLASSTPVPAGQIQIVDGPSVQRRAPYTMRELYDCVQYCPRVLPRLYLQIAAGSALIRSGEIGAKWILNDLIQAVKCEQNPIRGLFLRHYLLTALRDKLPDRPIPPDESAEVLLAGGGDDAATPPAAAALKETNVSDDKDPGTIKDSYQFVLENFMEMNKLWVRIQHLPGEGKDKDVRKRRERERNDLRILVGTNLVRLSQMEHVTSKIYGEVILHQILEHIVTCGDPLSQAYLMDCLVQAFPDEYHIETLPILLNVCPRLRDKVNIRTILQGLMDRLANYLADEELLDESDTNQVKKALARDSFFMFEDCVQKVYNARGPKLTSREVIRLQTALLQFSVKCYPVRLEYVGRCLGACVDALKQANATYELDEGTVASVPQEKIVIGALDEVAVAELEKLLSIPLEKLALKCLTVPQYNDLIQFLPWASRRQVAITLLQAVDQVGTAPQSVAELQRLFEVIEPLVREEPKPKYAAHPNVMHTTGLMSTLGIQNVDSGVMNLDPERIRENTLVSKLVQYLISDENTDVVYEMLGVARRYIESGNRAGQTMHSVVYTSIRLARRIFEESTAAAAAVQTASTIEEVKLESNGGEEKTTDASQGTAVKEEEVAVTDEATNGELSKETKESIEEPARGSDQESKKEPFSEDASLHTVRVSRNISCRKVFVFIQESIANLSKSNSESGVKLYLEAALVADSFVVKDEKTDYAAVAYELLSQAFLLYEESVSDPKAQQRCLEVIAGTLLAFKSLSSQEYESLIIKTAQFAAKVLKKPEQCQLVALCAYLFYPVSTGEVKYSNPQRALECLQRSLKLADACTSTNPANVRLFVELLEHYVYFFEKKNPAITHAYITGLIALTKEHISSRAMMGDQGVAEAKAHFAGVVQYIKSRKSDPSTSELYAPVQMENTGM